MVISGQRPPPNSSPSTVANARGNQRKRHVGSPLCQRPPTSSPAADVCRSFWVATTVWLWERLTVLRGLTPRRKTNCSCYGSMRIPTSTRRLPRRRETCMACRLPSCVASPASSLCSASLHMRPSIPAKCISSASAPTTWAKRERLRRRGVNLADMREIEQRGVAVSMRRILKTVAEDDGVLHVSLDADFVDPAFIPAVNVPVPGGITYAQARLIMQMLKRSGLVVSLDVAELNPLLDADGRSE